MSEEEDRALQKMIDLLSDRHDEPSNYTIVTNRMEYEKAISVARGSYQRAIIEGRENLSGSSLGGKARNYASKYAASRKALLSRLIEAGVNFRECVVRKTGRRILVIGEMDSQEWER